MEEGEGSATAGRAGVLANESANFDVELELIEAKRQAALAIAKPQQDSSQNPELHAPTVPFRDIAWKHVASSSYSSPCPSYLPGQVLRCLVGKRLDYAVVSSNGEASGKHDVTCAPRSIESDDPPPSKSPEEQASAETHSIDLSTTFSHPDTRETTLRLRHGWQMVGSRFAQSKEYNLHPNTVATRHVCWDAERVSGIDWIATFAEGHLECEMEGRLSVEQQKKVELLIEESRGGKMEFTIGGVVMAAVTLLVSGGVEETLGMGVLKVAFEASTEMRSAEWDDAEQQWKPPPQGAASMAVSTSYDESVDFVMQDGGADDLVGKLPSWSCVNPRQVDDFILGSRVFQRLQTSGAKIDISNEGAVQVVNCNDLEGVQRELRKFLRSSRQDLQVVLDAVVIPQAKRSVVLLPIFTYSRGEQVEIVRENGSEGVSTCVGVVDGLSSEGLYVCRVHNSTETVTLDLHEANHRPQPTFLYAEGTALNIYHDGGWSPARVLRQVDTSTIVAVEMQDGATLEVAVDLNPTNHSVLYLNSTRYEAVRSAYLGEVRDLHFGPEGTVVDMIAGVHVPLRKIETSLVVTRSPASPFCRPLNQISNASSLASAILSTEIAKPFQAVLRGVIGSGRSWALARLVLDLIDADGGDAKLVPLLINAKDLAKRTRTYRRRSVQKAAAPGHLISWYIHAAFGDQLDTEKMLLQAFDSKRLVLAIDGMDEAPDIQGELEACLMHEIAPLGMSFIATSLVEMSQEFEVSGNYVLLNMQPTTLEQRLAVVELLKPRFADYFNHAENIFRGRLDADDLYGRLCPGRLAEAEGIKTMGEWEDVSARPLQVGHWVPEDPTENLKILYERAAEAKKIFDGELFEIISDEASLLPSDTFDMELSVAGDTVVNTGILDWKAADNRLVVREIENDSAAFKAGVRVGMALESANEVPVSTARELKQLMMNMTESTITLTFSGMVLAICGLKDRKKARAKARLKYSMNHYTSDGTAAILDVVRATIMCETEEQVQAVMTLIFESQYWEVLRVRNRFSDIDATHNRRITINVSVNLGDTSYIAEIVVQLLPLLKHREAHPKMYVAPIRFFGRLLKDDTGAGLVANKSWDVFVRRIGILRSVLDSAEYTALLLNALQGAKDVSKLPPFPGTPAKLYEHALRGSIRRLFSDQLSGSESDVQMAQMRQRGLLDLLASIAFRAHERKTFEFDFDDVLEAAGEDNDIRDLWIRLSAERSLPFVLVIADDDFEGRQISKASALEAKNRADAQAKDGEKKKGGSSNGPKHAKRSSQSKSNVKISEEEAAEAAAAAAEAERIAKLSGVKSRYKFVSLGIQEYLASTGLLQELNRNPSGVQLWKIYGDNTDVLEDPFYTPMFDMLGEVQGASSLLFKARVFRSLHCTEQTVGGLAQMHRWYPHLDKIDLSQNVHISSMETFSAFKTIQSLRLVECAALRGSLEHLSTWSVLRVLTLAGTSLESDLKYLEGCTALEDVSFAGCNHISGTLDSFHAMKNLKYVDLAATDLKGTLDALANCTKLRALSLFQCDGVGGSLEPLANCILLQNLTLTLTQVYGPLDPLGKCPLLQEVRLSGTNVTGPLDALAQCKKLQMLSLYKTQVEGVLDPLSSCSEIMSIDVSGGMVYKYQPPREYNMKMEGNVTSLVNCRKLAFLRVEYTFITGNVSTLNAERARLDDKAEEEASRA